MNALPHTLEQWLEELAIRHPPHIMDFGLQSMQTAIQALGITPPPLVITVAGTNGKGSVVAQLEHLLCQAGVEVATYTSPHVYDFRERAKLSGKMYSDQQWVNAFTCIDVHVAGLARALTFFEWVTLAAFLLFHQSGANIWLNEIGLGGRLDAVNVFDNQLNIITNIDFDHTDRLGNTLQSIAREKAGVMRKGITTVSASKLPALRQLAREYEAHSIFIDDAWRFCVQQQNLQVQIGTHTIFSPIPYGILPVNTALALVAAWQLQHQYSHILPNLLVIDKRMNNQTMQYTLVDLHLVGRREQKIVNKICCLLDVAHNRAGIESLAKHYRHHYPQMPTVAVFGCLADKKPPTNLQQLFPQVQSWLVADIPGVRGQTAEQIINKIGIATAQPLRNFSALDLKRKVADGMLLGFGSFHIPPLVQEILKT